ncbi:Ig-like domain-containing protein, partial [Treponema berlinense]|uniref:Ig-like domain-containing protein n=1 Tax=Treponema berlinense TaxID=225004 RepID=UPI0026F0A29C
MKKFLRLTAALMAVFAMTNFIACSDGGSSSDDDLTITAESDVKEVEVGKTIKLDVVGTDADVTWTSSDTSKATVADGVVIGVAAGEVTITAKAPDGKTGTIKITVKEASSSGDSGSTGGSGSGDSGSTGGSGSGDSGSTGGTGSGDSGSTGGSGSGDSGSTGGTGEYKVVYNGEPIDEGTYTLEEAKALANKYELAEGTDYTIDEANKKIVLTDTGMQKVAAAMGGGSGEGGETGGSTGGTGEYKVVYGDITIAEDLTLEAATAMAEHYGLVETTDYTINTETKTITLTDSGMKKVEDAESGSGAGGRQYVVSSICRNVDLAAK